jgi:hypothetical protein
MRTRRNNFSLIGRLPPEILSCIFSFHASNQSPPKDPIHKPDDPSPSGSSPNRLGLGWITVTHICRRWRQVALSDPNLWSTIIFDLGAEWAEEMLARSEATLISYSRDLSSQPRVSTRRSVDDEATLRKHLSRVRRLVLSGDPESLAPAARALTTPAPHLESLELRNAPGNLCITLPSDLFAHDAPKLRHVTLFGLAIRWDSPLFRDLTHLEIRIPRRAPTVESILLSIPTVERLLSILEAMPSLQVLTLGNCLPRPESTGRVVPLRYMSKLSLDGSPSEVVAVLERVSLPSSASLSLHCPHHEDLDGPLETLVSLLASHFRTPETPTSPLSTIAIDEADYEKYLVMRVWDTDTDVPLHQQPQFRPSAPARLHLVIAKALASSLPLEVCKALPLRDLHTLSMTYQFPCLWSTAEWMDVCSHCPKVTHLCVRETWPSALASTLKMRNAFPSLVTLVLQDICLTAVLSEEHNSPLPVGALLPMFLRARKKAGIPVRRVNLKSCRSVDTWIVSLREAVNDVTWEIGKRDHDDFQRSSANDYDSWSDDSDDDPDDE